MCLRIPIKFSNCIWIGMQIGNCLKWHLTRLFDVLRLINKIIKLWKMTFDVSGNIFKYKPLLIGCAVGSSRANIGLQPTYRWYVYFVSNPRSDRKTEIPTVHLFWNPTLLGWSPELVVVCIRFIPVNVSTLSNTRIKRDRRTCGRSASPIRSVQFHSVFMKQQ